MTKTKFILINRKTKQRVTDDISDYVDVTVNWNLPNPHVRTDLHGVAWPQVEVKREFAGDFEIEWIKP